MKVKYLTILALFSLPVEVNSQSVLKKLKKVVEQVQTSATMNTSSKDKEPKEENTAQPTKATGSAEESSAQTLPNELDKLPKSNLVTADKAALAAKCGSFRKTEATKVINVDAFSGMKLGYFHDGRAFVHTSNNGVYCIDTKGNVIKQFKNSEISQDACFNSGRIILNTGYSEATVFDTDFKPVKKIANCSGFTDYADGTAMVTVKAGKNSFGNVSRYIDTNGNFVFDKLTQKKGLRIRSLNDGLAAYFVSDESGFEKKWGFRDTKGNIVVAAKYAAVDDFSNGMAAVALKSETDNQLKWGFIDKTGKEVIPPKFTVQPTRFDSCGLAMVTDKEGMNCFIDVAGNVVSGKYGGMDGENAVTPFCNGYALLEENNGAIFMIDKSFRKVKLMDVRGAMDYRNLFDLVPMRDQGMFVYGERITGSLYDFAPLPYADEYADVSTRYYFIRDGRMYVRLSGYRVEGESDSRSRDFARLTPEGDVDMLGLAGEFRNGIAPVFTNSGEVGYVNGQGEWIVKFEINEF